MEKSFYVIWNPAVKYTPQVRHPNVDSARREAMRLADKQPGHEFIVLRAVEGVCKATTPYRMRTFSKNG